MSHLRCSISTCLFAFSAHLTVAKQIGLHFKQIVFATMDDQAAIGLLFDFWDTITGRIDMTSPLVDSLCTLIKAASPETVSISVSSAIRKKVMKAMNFGDQRCRVCAG